MSVFNLPTLTSVAGEDNQLIASALGAAAILIATTVYYALRSKNKYSDFPKLGGIQLYHAWSFFKYRYDFLQYNFKRNLGKNFSFNVLHHTVIALAGEEARHAFYSDQHLNVSQGYKFFMGAVRVSLAQ